MPRIPLTNVYVGPHPYCHGYQNDHHHLHHPHYYPAGYSHYGRGHMVYDDLKRAGHQVGNAGKHVFYRYWFCIYFYSNLFDLSKKL